MAKAVDKAYQTVRERIVRGRLPRIARITEQEVAAAAGVSRTPVREHAQIARRRSAEFIPHQGAIGHGVDERDRDDVFELRALLEGYGAARPRVAMTPDAIVSWRQLAEDQYHETLSQARRLLDASAI